MISGISGTNNLYSLSVLTGSRTRGAGAAQDDPMNVFSTVDQDNSNSVSESEYGLLAEAIAQVTGTEMNSSFSDFDQDGDGELSAGELKLAMEEAGFKPPPPPPPSAGQVSAAYRTQSQQTPQSQSGQSSQGYGPDVLDQVLEYIRQQSGNLDIMA